MLIFKCFEIKYFYFFISLFSVYVVLLLFLCFSKRISKQGSMNEKDNVALRKKAMKKGGFSLYLDIYRAGVRKYEYLRLYLVPENTRADKARNKETMAFAEAVRAKRVVELRNGVFGFQNKSSRVKFAEFFNKILKEKEQRFRNSTLIKFRGLWKHLEAFDARVNTMFINQVTPEWIKRFATYLQTAHPLTHTQRKDAMLKGSSAKGTFGRLRHLIACAVREGLVPAETLSRIRTLRIEESAHERQFLTLDELRLLAATPCDNKLVERMFFFSCLTGLRFSDVVALRWSDVSKQGEFTRIVFHQQKTGALEYLDISPQAEQYMGARGNASERIFPYSSTVSMLCKHLRVWTKKAGIGKHITFHCARHTFACLMLDLNTDLYTVSKLLGHRNISTTQIYAKIIDKNKQTAVARIPQINTNS